MNTLMQPLLVVRSAVGHVTLLASSERLSLKFVHECGVLASKVLSKYTEI